MQKRSKPRSGGGVLAKRVGKGGKKVRRTGTRKLRFVRKSKSRKINMRVFVPREETLMENAFYLNQYLSLNGFNSTRFLNMIIRDVVSENYVEIPQDLRNLLTHPETVMIQRRLGPANPGYNFQLPPIPVEISHMFSIGNYIWNTGVTSNLLTYISQMPPNFSVWVSLILVIETGTSHKNLLEITKRVEGGNHIYVLKRFEPNYPSQELLFDISQTADVNRAMVETFRESLQLVSPNTIIRYEEFDPSRVACPMIGPQLSESSIPGRIEELEGYCVVWSNLAFYTILDHYAKTQTVISLEEAAKNIYERVRAFKTRPAVEYVTPEDLKEYIRLYSGKYAYEIFKSDLLDSPITFYPDRLHLLWKFIQKTIPYREVVEKMLGGFARIDQSPFEITIRKTPISRMPDYLQLREGETRESITSGNLILYGRPLVTPDYIYQVNIDGSVLRTVEKWRVGLLRLIDTSRAEAIDTDHVNVLLLDPGFRGKKLKSLTIQRFEPSYLSNSSPGSMSNLSEDSVWNQLLVLALKTYIPTTFITPDRKTPEIEFIYKPVTSGVCPTFGPQASEIAVPRGAGEHVGYCQTWSLKFIETFLRMKTYYIGVRVRGRTPDTQQIVEGTITGLLDNNRLQVKWDGQVVEYIYSAPDIELLTDMTNISDAVTDHMFREAGGTDSTSLYNYIKGVASRYAFTILNEFYLPLFGKTQMTE